MSPDPKRAMRTGAERGDIFKASLRRGLFNTLFELEPASFETLREEVLPPYLEMKAYLEESKQGHQCLTLRVLRATRDMTGASRADRRACSVALLDALDPWRAKWNLQHEDWTAAYIFAQFRRCAPGYPLQPVMTGPALAMSFVEIPAPVYVPLYESRAACLERVNAYVEEVEEAGRGSGWEMIPEKHSLAEHMKWFVRHQCLGATYEKSDTRPGRAGKESVQAQVKWLAAELPLTLRPAPGRRARE